MLFKRSPLLLTLLVITLGISAQQLPKLNPNRSTNITLEDDYFSKEKIFTKTGVCMDTISYPQSKLTNTVEIDSMDAAGYIDGVSQAYHFNGNGKIHGVKAYVLLDKDGVPGNTTPITLAICVYSLGTDNKPMSLIDSAHVQVIDQGFAHQLLLFNTPIQVADSFAITLELPAGSLDIPYYVTNNSVAKDGNEEALATIRFAGVWYNYGAQWDMDMMLAPLMEIDITATATTTSICPGEEAKLHLQSNYLTNNMFNRKQSMNPFGAVYNDDFIFNDTIQITQNIDSISIPVDTAFNNLTTDFTYTLIYYGYSNICTFNSDTIQQMIFPEINTLLTQSQDTLYTAPAVGASYNWYTCSLGNPSVSTGITTNYTTLQQGNNYGVAISQNGCIDSSDCFSPTITSINHYSNTQHFSIYPNPNNGIFTIQTSNTTSQIIIYDILGNIIEKRNPRNQKNIQLSGYSKGTYFVKHIQITGKSSTRKVVVK